MNSSPFHPADRFYGDYKNAIVYALYAVMLAAAAFSGYVWIPGVRRRLRRRSSDRRLPSMSASGLRPPRRRPSRRWPRIFGGSSAAMATAPTETSPATVCNL